MTKAKISQYDATAANNTDVNGVNIAEGCPPSSMNNMGREIMAALKRFQVGSDGDGVTVGGSLVVSGSTTANTIGATVVNASGNATVGGTLVVTGATTFSGNVVISGSTTATTVSTTVVQSDTISEKTSAAGVTIDGVLLKDNQINTDQINEKTSGTGVTVDGVLLKDGGATFTSPIIVTDIIYPVASFSWNSATASPAAAYTNTPTRLIKAHTNMRRCLLLDNGTVNYYLDPNDSGKKADGTASTLTGADGMVMVEIPAFYVRRLVVGTITTWFVADTALPGFVLHPAFTKNGSTVTHRYYSAYDACAFDVSLSTYISGLNRDNAVSNTPNVDVTATTGDKLASVSGIYPMVGLTRAQFRTIAANRGTGWRQLDWTLFSAVQVLYLAEYQTFFSQSVLGDGNVNGSYITQSGTQNDSPNSIAGLTNSYGNGSTRGNQASAGAKPGTAFMSYRGIENFYGNVFNFADGCIVNPDGSVSANQARMWWTNNSADFSDTVKTNMTEIAVNLATGSDYMSALASTDYFFVPTSVSGGSSSTYITDYWFGSTSDDRVVFVGGDASYGANVGAFVVAANSGSSAAGRSIGGRLAF